MKQRVLLHRSQIALTVIIMVASVAAAVPIWWCHPGSGGYQHSHSILRDWDQIRVAGILDRRDCVVTRTPIRLGCDFKDGVLTIRLTNLSENPIVVDRLLVLGLDVSLEDGSGKVIEPKETQVVPDAMDRTTAKRRFVSLEPGESVERKIDLKKPYRVFVTARSVPSHRVVAYEAKWKVPSVDRVRRIVVTYGGSSIFEDGFEAYVGESPSKVSLCLERAKAVFRIHSTRSEEKKQSQRQTSGGPRALRVAKRAAQKANQSE